MYVLYLSDVYCLPPKQIEFTIIDHHLFASEKTSVGNDQRTTDELFLECALLSGIQYIEKGLYLYKRALKPSYTLRCLSSRRRLVQKRMRQQLPVPCIKLSRLA